MQAGVDLVVASVRTVSDLAAEPCWPEWARQVHEELGMGSLLSMLLFTHERSFGAMNLYCNRLGTFTGDEFHYLGKFGRASGGRGL